MFKLNLLIGKGGHVKVLSVFKETNESDKSKELYNYLKENDLFKGSIGETYANVSPNGDNVIFLGLGSKDSLSIDGLRKAFYKLGKKLNKLKIKSATISFKKFEKLSYFDSVLAATEGILQSEYSFEKYLSEKKDNLYLEEFYLDVKNDYKEETKKAISEAHNIIEGIFLARDLVNEPAIVMTPKELATRAKLELEDLGVEVEIFDRDKIKELGMEAFLSVSKGSANEPQFIVMNWKGDSSSDKKLALVGKGLTYDSGGYSIKSNSGMLTMKSDMAGSASVIGAIKSIALSKLKKNVVGVIAACENLISGQAYKPGDIIGSMSGKTIEILNTDAEGRVTLADSLWYAATVLKADKIVDVATLTGACIVALGSVNTGAVTNNQDLMNDVLEASQLAGEPTWQFPTNEEYKEAIKGSLGDLRNSTVGGAGSITAGLFLGEFVNNVPWVHLDIAGPSFSEKNNSYLPKGATGVPVKTLYNLAKYKGV